MIPGNTGRHPPSPDSVFPASRKLRARRRRRTRRPATDRTPSTAFHPTPPSSRRPKAMRDPFFSPTTRRKHLPPKHDRRRPSPGDQWFPAGLRPPGRRPRGECAAATPPQPEGYPSVSHTPRRHTGDRRSAGIHSSLRLHAETPAPEASPTEFHLPAINGSRLASGRREDGRAGEYEAAEHHSPRRPISPLFPPTPSFHSTLQKCLSTPLPTWRTIPPVRRKGAGSELEGENREAI